MHSCPKKLALLLSLIGLNLSWSDVAFGKDAAESKPQKPAATGNEARANPDEGTTVNASTGVAREESAHVVDYASNAESTVPNRAKRDAKIARLRSNLGLAASVTPHTHRRAQRFVHLKHMPTSVRAIAVRGERSGGASPGAKHIARVAVKPAHAQLIAGRAIEPATPGELTGESSDPLMPLLRTLAAAESRQQTGAFTGEFDLPIADASAPATAPPDAPAIARTVAVDEVYEPIDFGPPATAVAVTESPRRAAPVTGSTPAAADDHDDYFATKRFLAPESLARAFAREVHIDPPSATPAAAQSVLSASVAPTAQRPIADWPWLRNLDTFGSSSHATLACNDVSVPIGLDGTMSTSFDIFDRALPAPRASKESVKARRAAARVVLAKAVETQKSRNPALDVGVVQAETIDIFDPDLASVGPEPIAYRMPVFERLDSIAAPAMPASKTMALASLPQTMHASSMLTALLQRPTPGPSQQYLKLGIAPVPTVQETRDAVWFDIYDATLAAPPSAIPPAGPLRASGSATPTGSYGWIDAQQRLPAGAKRPTHAEPAYNAIADAVSRAASTQEMATGGAGTPSAEPAASARPAARVARAIARADAGAIEIPLDTSDVWDEHRVQGNHDSRRLSSAADTMKAGAPTIDQPTDRLDGTLVAVSDTKLDEMRGGFEGDGGLKISFGIERAVYINGSLVTTTSLNIADLSKLNGGQAVSTLMNGASLGLIQNGPGNTFQPGQISASSVGTVIQNTLNNQNIQGVTLINATVNSIDLVKSSAVQSSIRNAITDSLRR